MTGQGPFTPFDPHGNSGGPGLRDIPLRTVVPNLVTVLAICAGLSGIRLAFEHRFETAVLMVLIAAFLDGIDGRLARMLKASSKFGAQMDSLADIVNFGVAPALVLYAYLLHEAGSFGWIAALLFAIACGLRLARFNVMTEEPARPSWEADYFVGVPAPAGAVVVMLPVYAGFLDWISGPGWALAASVYAVCIALLLVSRWRVYSGKSAGQRIRRDLVMPGLLLAVVYVLILFMYPWPALAVSTVIYLLLLPASIRGYRRREAVEAAKAAAARASEPSP